MVAKGGNDSNPELTVAVSGKRYNKGVLEPKIIHLAKESPYALFLNDREILSISTLPTHLRELFVGFLVSEGVLLKPKEIMECEVDHSSKLVRIELDVPRKRLANVERKGMLTSGCAGGMVFSVQAATMPRLDRPKLLTISSSSVLKRMYELDTYPGTYAITRGVHAASVATLSETLVILEDLGRHNAVDKIVGHCFLNQIETARQAPFDHREDHFGSPDQGSQKLLPHRDLPLQRKLYGRGYGQTIRNRRHNVRESRALQLLSPRRHGTDGRVRGGEGRGRGREVRVTGGKLFCAKKVFPRTPFQKTLIIFLVPGLCLGMHAGRLRLPDPARRGITREAVSSKHPRRRDFQADLGNQREIQSPRQSGNLATG